MLSRLNDGLMRFKSQITAILCKNNIFHSSSEIFYGSTCNFICLPNCIFMGNPTYITRKTCFYKHINKNTLYNKANTAAISFYKYFTTLGVPFIKTGIQIFIFLCWTISRFYSFNIENNFPGIQIQIWIHRYIILMESALAKIFNIP